MSDGYFGLLGAKDTNGAFNATGFQIEQAMRQARTAIPVKVVAVSGGSTAGAPTVDVLPLVNQMDGQGNMTAHTTVHGIPCTRVQGGGNGIICDPQVGDLGFMVVADRDISAVKSSSRQSNPGSRRIHSMADGVYVGAMVVSSLTQYVEFTDTGVRIVDMNGNTIVTSAAGVTITAPTVRIEGALSVTGEVTAQADGASVSLSTHTHGGVSSGSADTATPNAGT